MDEQLEHTEEGSEDLSRRNLSTIDLDARERKYLGERWQSQRDYFSKKSGQNKAWHNNTQIFIGIAGVLVPILINIPEVPKIFPTLLSAFAAVAMVLENVNQYGQNWRNYRLTLEALKLERVLYDACAGIYQEPETRFETFVDRCERIISQDIVQFQSLLDEAQRNKSNTGATNA